MKLHTVYSILYIPSLVSITVFVNGNIAGLGKPPERGIISGGAEAESLNKIDKSVLEILKIGSAVVMNIFQKKVFPHPTAPNNSLKKSLRTTPHPTSLFFFRTRTTPTPHRTLEIL